MSLAPRPSDAELLERARLQGYHAQQRANGLQNDLRALRDGAPPVRDAIIASGVIALGPNAIVSAYTREKGRRGERRVRALTTPTTEAYVTGLIVTTHARPLDVAGIVTVVLPSPPSSREAWRLMKGRIVTSKAQHAYKRAVAEAVKNQIADATPTTDAIAVEMDWYRPSKKGDLDNRAKVVLDALQGILYANDSQIVELHMRRFDDKARPRLIVTIQEVSDR